ncbi:MAG: nitrogen regulation protein NR(II) [Thermodesulfobacteriota bacterium]
MQENSVNMYEDIIDSFMGGVVYIDLSARLLVFSQGAERISGFSRKMALKRPLQEVFHRDSWFTAIMEETLSGERTYTEHKGVIHRSFAAPLSVTVTTGVVFSKDGSVAGALAFIRTPGAGARALEGLSPQGDGLSGMSFFAARLVHEIRNPLGGIRAAAQLLSRKTSERGLTGYTDIIIRETDRLDTMLKEVAAFTAPRRDVNKEINIHRLLDSVILLILGDNHGVIVQKEYDPSLPHVSGDDGALVQVFLNLLKNAAEAVREDGRITVVTRIMTDFYMSGGSRRAARMVSVEITDNGCGITEQDMEKVFTPFFTTKQGGSGLGMALSLKIVRDQGGYLKIESREGEGTRVRVLLPVAHL